MSICDDPREYHKTRPTTKQPPRQSSPLHISTPIDDPYISKPKLQPYEKSPVLVFKQGQIQTVTKVIGSARKITAVTAASKLNLPHLREP